MATEVARQTTNRGEAPVVGRVGLHPMVREGLVGVESGVVKSSPLATVSVLVGAT
jgi:hypothetical protein